MYKFLTDGTFYGGFAVEPGGTLYFMCCPTYVYFLYEINLYKLGNLDGLCYLFFLEMQIVGSRKVKTDNFIQ